MADLFENLNNRQQEAVLETEGYVRVIAGAGSGKTKLLVSRYAYLVQDYGIDSSNILCVTFTNKAAGEMKKRIRGLIGDDNAVSLICTYHGFCNRLLRENPEKLFLNKQFQILDNHQQKAVLSEIYQKFELKLDYASFEAILRKIGQVKKDLKYVPRMCSPEPCPILDEIKNQDDRIIEDFLQRQKATYSLDFHDLISFAIYLLETDGDIREKWQDRLNYIMVDEFQDSSSVEMRLVEILSGKYRNLMIVGDPDQNIYEWRGSDVRLLVDFDKTHESTRTIILNQNYRSTPQILKCANTLIEKNELRLKKDLFTKNGPGEPVVHYHSRDDFEEMDRVTGEIQRLHRKEGFRYSDFAVIYRSGFLSRVAEKKLVEKNIPYEIFGGVRFYQRMEILDILAYLKLIAYDDDSAFRRVVNTPRRKFGRVKMNFLEELREHLQSYGDLENRRSGFRTEHPVDAEDGNGQGWYDGMPGHMNWYDGRPGERKTENGGLSRDENYVTLFQTLSDHLEMKEFENSDVTGFVDFVWDMRKKHPKLRISEIVNEVTEKSGYESYIRELGDEERLDNLAEFKRIANEFEREFGENLSLGDFLQQIALQSGEEDGDESRDTVKLMTIHASKGLEFPVVFILGFTEGVFPSAKTLGERKKLGLEEERRLCYVAITRAEKYLFLMESEGTSQNGIKKLVSRFLEEIGEENYKRIGRISEELKKESRGYAAKLNGEMQEEPVHIMKPGDTVEHHAFGKGVIQAVDARRGSYSILFEKLQHPRNISGSYFAKKQENQLEKAAVNAELCNSEPPDFCELDRNEGKTGPDREKRELNSQSRDYDEGDENRESNLTDFPESDAGKKEAKLEENWEELQLEQIDFQETDAVREEAELEDAGEELQSESTNFPDLDETGEEAARLALLKENSPNLWKREDVPHSGWSCTGVDDLGGPVGICQMCGYQIIRYAHQMEHPQYRSLSVGCVCAGRMEGDIAGAKQREAEFKKRQSRRIHFFRRKWKMSKKGNEYLKIDGHVVVIYHITRGNHIWKYSLDNDFCKGTYATRERAMAGAFNALEKLRSC